LKILGAYDLIDSCALRSFLLTCQSPVIDLRTSSISLIPFSDSSGYVFRSLLQQYGGFTKFPDDRIPDIYHSYYGLAALSLLEEEGLEPLCVELGILSAAAL
jgi:geranylgeranyl transferase type-1 subunit beta